MANNSALARGAVTLYDAAKLRTVAKNSSEQLKTLEKIHQQGEATAQELNDISSKMDVQINIQKRQHILAEQADREKKEQKLLKNVLYAFKMDYESASQIGIGIKRYVMLKTLLVIYENELMGLIEKLDEIQDKEFAANLYKSLSGDVKQAFTALKEDEIADFNNLKGFFSQTASIKDNIVELNNLKDYWTNEARKIISESGLSVEELNTSPLKQTRWKLGLVLSILLYVPGWIAYPIIFSLARRRRRMLVDKINERMKEVKIAENNKKSLVDKMDSIVNDAKFKALLAKYEVSELEAAFSSI